MTEYEWLVIGLLGLLGILVGSFLNVVIARVPVGSSVLRPRSACPNCGSPLIWRDNIPLLSWVLLRGQCRNCRCRISARYPIVELVTGVTWSLIAMWGFQNDSYRGCLPLILVLASAGIALTAIDLAHHRLPDVIVLPMYPVLLVGLILSQVLTAESNWVGASIGASIWLMVIGGLWLVTGGRGMGFGDVKLAPILGAVLGWGGIELSVIGLLAAFVAGAIIGLGLMLFGRARRGSHIPFGPFMFVGFIIGVVVGESLWVAYRGVTGL